MGRSYWCSSSSHGECHAEDITPVSGATLLRIKNAIHPTVCRVEFCIGRPGLRNCVDGIARDESRHRGNADLLVERDTRRAALHMGFHHLSGRIIRHSALITSVNV